MKPQRNLENHTYNCCRYIHWINWECHHSQNQDTGKWTLVLKEMNPTWGYKQVTSTIMGSENSPESYIHFMSFIFTHIFVARQWGNWYFHLILPSLLSTYIVVFYKQTNHKFNRFWHVIIHNLLTFHNLRGNSQMWSFVNCDWFFLLIGRISRFCILRFYLLFHFVWCYQGQLCKN